jgi:hypothetical protein
MDSRKIFDNTNDCINLLKQKWKEAAQFGDVVSYKAATSNADWWYEQLDTIEVVDKTTWNSCSYGNVAMGIYGQQFEERHENINRLKMILARDL